MNHKISRLTFGTALPLLALGLMTACSTQPIPTEQATAVASNHITAKQLLTRRAGTCELTVLRDVGLLGGGVGVQLYIDKAPIATLKTGEILTLWITPGVHKFGVLPTFNLFGATSLREFDYDIKNTRRNSIRIGVGQDGPIFVPTAY